MTLLKVSEAAAEIRVSVPTVYRLIQDGDLQSVRIRKAIRIRREELDRYLQEVAD